MDSWLIAGGVTGIVASGVYGYVGRRISQRPVPVEAQFAAMQFTIWWYAIGATAAIGGMTALIDAAGALTYPLGLTIDLGSILTAVVALWGLVGYLTYVYTGRHYLFWLSLFYGVFYFAVLYYMFVQDPYSVSVVAGSLTLHYHGTAPVGLTVFVVLALLIPEFAGAVLYLSLYRRTTDRTLRFRILMIGFSILVWFGVALFLPSNSSAWGLARSISEVLASLLSLVAYIPPRGLRERFGIVPLDTGAGTPA